MPANTSNPETPCMSNDSTTSTSGQSPTLFQSSTPSPTGANSTDNSSELTAAPASPPLEEEKRLLFKATLGCVAMNRLLETASPSMIEYLTGPATTKRA
ncbi:hypothetical protein HGRIS_006002 [Hohenbuehelia grisea]|uniref:Uncharacterized protein n=1 Tax=Hohenbuehelia grisea TaxID=104357 RepID=A0ABR3JYM0_9AGAR